MPQNDRATMKRLILLALVGGLVAAVLAVTSTAARSTCTHGASSIGPIVLVHGHLAKRQSSMTPHSSACLDRLNR